MDRLRPSTRAVVLGGLMALAVAGCRTTGQKPDYVQPTPTPTQTPSASPLSTPAASSSPLGPTAHTSTTFEQPFTITLPPGWLIGDQDPNMVSFYLPMGPNQGPRLGVDIQEVSQVLKDPCGHGPTYTDPGQSPQDLASWMAAWAPLHASKPVAGKLGGINALVVEEAFDGSCDGPNLWPTPGGYLDPAEHKRYAILDVGGKRVVVTLVGRDDTWDATLADGEQVLDSLTFTNP
jgi:hypothetical protein